LCYCFAAGSPVPFGPEGRLEDKLHKPKATQTEVKPSVRFNLRTSKDPEHEGCYLSVGHSQPLEDCSFNMTAKTFFIIHGWTMSGIFENWLHKLVSALHTREKDANVVVVDWLPLAHQLYTDAVNNTRVVGHSIARMLDWLQVLGDERESPVASRISNPIFLRNAGHASVAMNFWSLIKIFEIKSFIEL
ncbi:LIPG isoform 6, partial [Pan troglodytes]